MNKQEWKKITKNVLNIYDNLSSTSKVLEKIKDQLETHELCNKSRESKPAGVKKSRVDNAHNEWKRSLRNSWY